MTFSVSITTRRSKISSLHSYIIQWSYLGKIWVWERAVHSKLTKKSKGGGGGGGEGGGGGGGWEGGILMTP